MADVKAILIIEIAGRPKEHLVGALKEHIAKFNQIKDVELVSESYSEPKQVENKDFYTCFAEIEIEVENFNKLTEVVFDFMPASVEVIKPDKVSFDLVDATSFLNNLSGRLHRYDEIAKVANFRMQQMAQQLQFIQQKQAEEDSKKESKKSKKKTKKTKKKKSKKKTKKKSQ